MAKKAAKKKAPAKKLAKKKGAPQRKPEQYLVGRAGQSISLVDYTKEPAVSFLKQVVEAKNTFDYCKRKFSTNNGNNLSNEAKDNLQQITGPLFAVTMGHFETFQKCLFSGLFEATRLLRDWDPEKGTKAVDDNLNISAVRMCAYRGQGAQIGLLFADSLNGWHSPDRVNKYFKCFDESVQLFSNKQIGDIKVLWQIRHTLVHTGGWLTLPDAQKVSRLSDAGDSALAFNEHFMLAFTRLMHKAVKGSVERIEQKLKSRLKDNLDQTEKDEFNALVKVDSPARSYFN